MREQDSACASAKFNHLEWKGLTSSCRLTIFLDEVASECESFVITFQFDVSSLVSHGSNRALYGRADRIFFLNCVPRIRGELLVTQAELVVRLIEVKDHDINLISRRNDF